MKRIFAAVLLAVTAMVLLAVPMMAATSYQIDESSDSDSHAYSNQRKVLYAAGRWWVFYADGSNVRFSNSTDGATWSAFNTLGVEHSGGQQITAEFDGTYLHYARTFFDGARWDYYYRRGIPCTNGTIIWSAAEQLAYDNGFAIKVALAVSTEGYAFIGYRVGTGVDVMRNANNDGTWSTADTTELTNNNTNEVALVPLTDGKIYAVYGNNNQIMYGKEWDSGWSEAQQVSAVVLEDSCYFFSVVAHGDTVEFVYNNNNNLRHCDRTGGIWTDNGNILAVDVAPTLSLLSPSGDLRVTYESGNKIYYFDRYAGTWDGGATMWLDESSETMPQDHLSVTYEAPVNTTAVSYVTNATAPYFVKFGLFGAPIVTSSAATNLTFTTADLHGTVVDDSGDTVTHVGFEWGPTSGVYVDDWTVAYTTDNFMYTLNATGNIFWRAFAINAFGTGVSAERSLIGSVSNLRAVPSATFISLSWTTTLGVNRTHIRYSTTGYPTSLSDGSLAYNGTSASCVHAGLTPGTTYYYRAWAYSWGEFSDLSVTVMMTTSASVSSGGDIVAVSPMPANWFTGTDYTNMANMPILYGIGNRLADAINMPRNTAWFLLAVILSLALGVIAFFAANKQILAGVGVAVALLGLASVAGLMPGYIPILGLVFIFFVARARKEVSAG